MLSVENLSESHLRKHGKAGWKVRTETLEEAGNHGCMLCRLRGNRTLFSSAQRSRENVAIRARPADLMKGEWDDPNPGI